MSGMHEAARVGFEAGAEAYARGRPDYPAEIAGWLQATLALCPGKTVADLGAGTGKFTRALLATGAHVIAVEPVAAMRAELAATGAEIRDGVAEAPPLGDASLDALVCAQAFHWFATAGAIAQMRRVLKIGGRLGLVWNVRDETVPWVAALTKVIAPYEGDAPRFGSGRWREVFPAPGFAPLAEVVFQHAHVGPPDQVVVDRLLSTSFIAALDAATRAEIAYEAHRILIAYGLDGAEVAFPYQTRAFSAARLN